MTARRLILLFLVVSGPVPGQEDVRFEADDGQKIAATWYAPRGSVRGGIVLLHMYRTNRIVWSPLAPRLAARGFHVLALDLRGHGASRTDPEGENVDISRAATADPATNPFLKMHLDAKAALELLVEKGAPKDHLALVGASVGCSVALHAAAKYPDLVRAVVLMTPGSAYLGVPSLEHAKTYGDRPALILSSEEEANVGARPLKAIMPGKDVELRIVPGEAIHGTRMFGRVPAIEADIIEWLEKALASRLVVDIPLARDVIVDGELGKSEGSGARWIEIPMEESRTARVRISRNRARLVVGFDVPERCLRRNEVVVYLDGTGEGPALPQAGCWRISFSPKNSARSPLVISEGSAGTWKEVRETAVLAYAKTADRGRWTSELALLLSRFVGRETPCSVRIAFTIGGQRKGQRRFWPASPNIQNAPRTWAVARLAGP